MNTRLKKLLNERASTKKETSPSSQDQQREQRLIINNHYQLPVANRYSSKERMVYKPEDALVFTYVKEIGTFKVIGFTVQFKSLEVTEHTIIATGTCFENEIECMMLALNKLQTEPDWNNRVVINWFTCSNVVGSQIMDCIFIDPDYPFRNKLMGYMGRRRDLIIVGGVGMEDEKNKLIHRVDTVILNLLNNNKRYQ
jgi:hypothetical protein